MNLVDIEEECVRTRRLNIIMMIVFVVKYAISFSSKAHNDIAYQHNLSTVHLNCFIN